MGKADAAAVQAKAEEKIVASKKEQAKEIADKAAAAIASAKAKMNAANAMLKKIDNAQCSKHAGCKGLAGYCCPTLNFNNMHMGSTELAGPVLGCCGSMEEEDLEEVEGPEEQAAEAPQSGLIASVFLAFASGSAVTALAFKLAPGTKNDASYQHLAA